MPTYDYECDSCGHTFELFQSISEPVKRKCPECNKAKLRRLFGTGGAIVFKGSGFYQTDYRSESYKKGEQAAKKKSDKADGKKPDAKKSDSQSTSSAKKTDSGGTGSTSPKSTD